MTGARAHAQFDEVGGQRSGNHAREAAQQRIVELQARWAGYKVVGDQHGRWAARRDDGHTPGRHCVLYLADYSNECYDNISWQAVCQEPNLHIVNARRACGMSEQL